MDILKELKAANKVCFHLDCGHCIEGKITKITSLNLGHEYPHKVLFEVMTTDNYTVYININSISAYAIQNPQS